MSTFALGPPQYRSIVSIDIEGSTTRTNPNKASLRQVLYDLFEEALRACGILEDHRDALIDRGDGLVALIHPVDEAPKTLLLTALAPTLGRLLVEHNARSPQRPLRMRAAVHAGEVHYDRQGCFGEALDLTFRLLDAPEVRIQLSRTQAPLVLVVSDDIYRSVMRHRYDGIDHRVFEQLVRVRIAGRQHGWVFMAAESPVTVALRPGRDSDSTAPGRRSGSNRSAALATPASPEPGSVPPALQAPAVTGDPQIDKLLHLAGQALDARATVEFLDPDTILNNILPRD